MEKRIVRWGLGIWATIILFQIGFWGTVIWAAVHFIKKYW